MTPHELTMLLYRAGALQQGSVIEIQTIENEAFNSHVQHLKIRCSPDALPRVPTDLVLKTNVPTDWGTAQRQRRQARGGHTTPYLATLHAHGITNYTWGQLLEDYRLMIVIFLQVAIWDQTNGSQRSYWWPKLQCLLGAARDLDCRSLLLST